MTVYVCPTQCDADCEMNGGGCHMWHYPNHGKSEARPHGHWRDHDPEECERLHAQSVEVADL